VTSPTDQSPAGRTDDGDLSILRSAIREPVDHLECFPAPAACTNVRFSTDELTSMCPVTGQPDFSSVEIDYDPDRLCIESKSLKLYLWSFRDRAAFAEALAAEIAAEVHRAADPKRVRVVVTQKARGGIVNQSTAEL
jgi:7-cyano-7-deazaguanine reductase